jgi:hypothetical protein
MHATRNELKTVQDIAARCNKWNGEGNEESLTPDQVEGFLFALTADRDLRRAVLAELEQRLDELARFYRDEL